MLEKGHFDPEAWLDAHIPDRKVYDYPFLRKVYSSSSGNFRGTSWENREIGEPIRLLPPELFVKGFLELQLERREKIRVLGIGEMCAFGFVAIASHMRDCVDQGRLEFIATNAEPDFEIVAALTEVEKRLYFFGSLDEWHKLRKDYPGRSIDRGARWLQANRPILGSYEQLQFIADNRHLVTYRSGIEVSNLDFHFTQEIEEGGFALVHEGLGGIFHSLPHKRRFAFEKAMSVLKPKTGLLMTGSGLVDKRYVPTPPFVLTYDGQVVRYGELSEYQSANYRLYPASVEIDPSLCELVYQ